MRVRYYSDTHVKEWHNHALKLLATVHDEHGIAVEIDRIVERHGLIRDFPGDVRQTSAQAVYDRDLKHNRALTDTIDQRPSRAFKRYGKLDVAGNVAMVDESETVRWASTLPGFADGYGPGAKPHAAMNFLEDFATSPSNRVCIDCLALLDGDENFCPNCGYDL